jgi:tetratricopeptide (TPR) repeat protein
VKSHKSKWNVLLTAVVSIFIVLISYAQETDKSTKLRLAQGFEEAGEWERSVALYEDLFASEPMNYIYLDGLQRSYKQIKEYNKAVNVIHHWLSVHPKDANLMAILGGLYYDLGMESTSDSVWNAVISLDPHNMQLYRVVTNELMEHRLYDQCIRMYNAGRSVSKNPILFNDELGSLYIALQQYALATQEYIQLIKASPDQLSFVQSRLSALTSKPEALQTASKKVQTELINIPDNITLHRLYVWFLMEEQRYDLALEQYRMIDKLSSANGNELFNFAQRLNQEHGYKEAIQAFKEIIEKYNNQQLLQYARFGYARAVEESCKETDTTTILPDTTIHLPVMESQINYKNAIHLYESIVAENSGPDLKAQSLFRIGMLKFEKLFDLDGALAALKRIKEIPQTPNIWYEASLNIGIIHEARNDLIEARKTFVNLNMVSLISYRDQALFKLAELDYFEAHFDSSLSHLRRFNINLNNDLANDALQLQYFIQENKNTSAQALGEFAKADLLIRQRKYSESLTQFQDIIKRYPTAMLMDDALMKISELYILLKQTSEALTTLHFITDSIQTSILRDRAQFQIGEAYRNILKNKAKAIEAYEKLLARFPNSLYAEEARRQIRTLRGDRI